MTNRESADREDPDEVIDNFNVFGNLLNLIQTKPGMDFFLGTWYMTLEQAPWASKTTVGMSLWEENAVMVPLHAIKYNWTGASK